MQNRVIKHKKLSYFIDFRNIKKKENGARRFFNINFYKLYNIFVTNDLI